MSGFSLRADRGELSPPITATIYEGRVARTHAPGDALIYKTGPEHRDASEVQNIVSQLAGLPVYLGHPPIFPAKDSGQKIVGTVESGRMDEDTAVGRLSITDAEALAAVQAGTHELSLGYRCALDGERYQRGIQLDHLAIVERARCGPACALRVDMLFEENKEENQVKAGTIEIPVSISLTDEAKQALETLAKLETETKTDDTSTTCTCKNRAINHNIGETMSDVNKDTELQGKLDAALAEVASLKTRVTELEVEATNARKDADKAKSDLEAAQAEVEKAKTDAADEIAKVKADADDAAKAEFQTRVDARVALLTEAGRFDLKDAEGNKLELNKLSDREIKCAVIKHVDGDEVPADKPDAFVDGVYSGSLKRGAAAAGSREAVRVAIDEMRKDGSKEPVTGRSAELAAKEAMKRESALAWTK